MTNYYCPICHKKLASDAPVSSKNFPFCSERCRMVDLGNWFSEGYKIPASSDQNEEQIQNAPSENQ